MKKLLILLVLFTVSFLSATEQEPDILFYNKSKLYVDIGWGHPSPLEVYYRRENLKYPFTMLHTANYRGHIATWKIEGNKLYLTKVEVEDKTADFGKIGLKLKDNKDITKERIFAHWFTGVLSATYEGKNEKEERYEMYFYIKNGVVKLREKIGKEDVNKLQKFTAKDTINQALFNKYKLLYLNQSYISYFFRSHEDEKILINDKAGKIRGRKGMSLVLENYKDGHYDWPFNWENENINGAPNATYEIKKDKLFVTSLKIHSGLNFDGPEITEISLNTLFPKKYLKNKVLADWISGIYLVSHGEEVSDKHFPKMKLYKIKEYTLLNIEKGNVLEQYGIPKDYDFKNPPKETNPKTKILIDKFLKQ